MYRKDFSPYSCGILTYCSSSLQPRRLLSLEQSLPESIVFEIKDNSKSYIIVTVYRQPNSTVEFWQRLDIFLELASEISKKNLFQF